MVDTSVPLLNPPEPETACPTETGRVRTVQSNGARIFRLGQLVFDQVQRLIGAVEGVAGQLILRLRVLEEFLRDKFVGIELFGPFVVALRLLQLQFRRFDFDQFRRAIRLQVLVVEREQHAVFFDPVTNVHRQCEDFAVDFRADRNLVGRADFPAALTAK